MSSSRGEHVHRALRRPHRLHRAVAAEGAVGRQVRVDRQRVHAHVRDPVRPDAGVAELRRHARAAVGVGAGVDPAVELLGDERAVAPGADPHADRGRVAVERDELLGAVEHDLDRPPGLAGERGDDRLECARTSWRRTSRPSAARRRARRPRARPKQAGEVGAHVERRLRRRSRRVRRPSSHSASAACGSIGACAALGVAERLLDDHVGLARSPAATSPWRMPEAVADVACPAIGRTPIETASSADAAASGAAAGRPARPPRPRRRRPAAPRTRPRPARAAARASARVGAATAATTSPA